MIALRPRIGRSAIFGLPPKADIRRRRIEFINEQEAEVRFGRKKLLQKIEKLQRDEGKV
ncbi:hypothetical protein [Roseibium aggregatum]|uniref:hypothetical protein n=1 Tax=Roseibium aggregatum TaxID=187304 RepID=UPI001E557BA3|nr:hypothetical protein [Roseibium aggregatum]